MSLLRPPSDDSPGEQASQTPSGKKVPMVVDAMVRMIQKASSQEESKNKEADREEMNGN